jgi:hypothetical protein
MYKCFRPTRYLCRHPLPTCTFVNSKKSKNVIFSQILQFLHYFLFAARSHPWNFCWTETEEEDEKSLYWCVVAREPNNWIQIFCFERRSTFLTKLPFQAEDSFFPGKCHTGKKSWRIWYSKSSVLLQKTPQLLLLQQEPILRSWVTTQAL